MVGLFIVLPVFSLFGEHYRHSTPMLAGLAIGSTVCCRPVCRYRVPLGLRDAGIASGRQWLVDLPVVLPAFGVMFPLIIRVERKAMRAVLLLCLGGLTLTQLLFAGPGLPGMEANAVWLLVGITSFLGQCQAVVKWRVATHKHSAVHRRPPSNHRRLSRLRDASEGNTTKCAYQETGVVDENRAGRAEGSANNANRQLPPENGGVSKRFDHEGPVASRVEAMNEEPAQSLRSTASSKMKDMLSSPLQLSERLEMIRIISNRLFIALCSLMIIAVVGGILAWKGHALSAGATNGMVVLSGAIGGFISLQRRLKTMSRDDLLLLARSWVYVLLSPLVGGILALLLYFLFMADLLKGDLFPLFTEVLPTEAGDGSQPTSRTGLTLLFNIQGVGYADYAKLVFWCFLAGYSESFVTNIISSFESSAGSQSGGQARE